MPAMADSSDEHLLLADSPPAIITVLPADVVQQSLKAAGDIDRQLRAEHPQEPAAPSDTAGTRLANGMAAANAAVKPKWFEKAQSELVSAPNDPRKIYRITSAKGEYCLYYPDKASMSLNSRATAGRADFGRPTMANCPKPF